MAGLAATRLFAAGGAGGVALTAWALRRSGMERREVAERMIAFLVAALRRLRGRDGRLRDRAARGDLPRRGAVRADGRAGDHRRRSRSSSFGALALVPEDFERRASSGWRRAGRALARWLRRFALAPASMRGGIRFALHKAVHPDLAMIGVDHVVGVQHRGAVGVVPRVRRRRRRSPCSCRRSSSGCSANLLPIPGGIGGVDGGMIGALAAFGVPRRHWPCWRCSRIVCSRSGCRRCRA